jgi:hypothetical protein
MTHQIHQKRKYSTSPLLTTPGNWTFTHQNNEISCSVHHLRCGIQPSRTIKYHQAAQRLAPLPLNEQSGKHLFITTLFWLGPCAASHVTLKRGVETPALEIRGCSTLENNPHLVNISAWIPHWLPYPSPQTQPHTHTIVQFYALTCPIQAEIRGRILGSVECLWRPWRNWPTAEDLEHESKQHLNISMFLGRVALLRKHIASERTMTSSSHQGSHNIFWSSTMLNLHCGIAISWWNLLESCARACLF